jgi:ParB family chromosome partitioning protein
MEEARGLLRLQKEFNISQQDVASAVGKSRSGVANILRLNNLCKEAQNLLESSSIDMGHARALLTLPEGPQASFAKQAAKNGWSVRQTEKAAQDYLSGSGKTKTPKRKDANISALEEEISNELSSSVSIQHKKNGSGKIIFSYRDLDQLDKIIGPFRKKS